MTRPISLMTLGLLLAPLCAPALPVMAQEQETVKEQMLIVYGDDPCPASSGDDIVVCARKPESERYRIPEKFREAAPTPAAESWAERARSIEYVGRTGTNSCSTVGPGGWTGCYQELMRQAREEQKAKKASVSEVP